MPLEDWPTKAAGGKASYVGQLVIYERERPGLISRFCSKSGSISRLDYPEPS